MAKENKIISHERDQQRSTKRQEANVLAPETSVMLLKPGLLSSLEPCWTPRWAIVRERHTTYWVRQLPTSKEKVIHPSRIQPVHTDIAWPAHIDADITDTTLAQIGNTPPADHPAFYAIYCEIIYSN